ncbi:hypothetical protein AL705_04970 [Lawsonella clevelandensis]|uniref:MspA family protein n=1 Tax=Lawsonella clevelandensis TaxID=1528099 RepID=A0A0M5L0I8_9ACTN|nr:MspA family porin [Lawsonella clevelandensis]ALE19072.1 hypothetical protein AL705_04970 [Lawsonella clevelandensis]
MFRFSSPARAAAAYGLSLILSAGISIPASAVTLPNKDQVRTIRGEDGRTITLSKLDERLRPVIPLAGNSFGHEGFIDLTGYSHAGVKLTNLEFNIASCAGIVSIRSFVRLIYHTPISLDNTTIYGQPRYL